MSKEKVLKILDEKIELMREVVNHETIIENKDSLICTHVLIVLQDIKIEFLSDS